VRTQSGIIDWQPWRHLTELLDVLAKERFVIILKAKQIGLTWMMAGANLHQAMFSEGANVLTLSKGQEEATEALDYSRFLHSQLPDFLRLRLGQDQASLLTFPTIHSKLRALPSTEDAGVGFGGASRVVSDEFEYHKYAEKNYAEIYPSIEKSGQMVILSTADNEKQDTKFKQLYRDAKEGRNRFVPIFLPRNVLPERTQEWYDSLDMSQAEKECRYPLTERDALNVVQSRKFFDENIIQQMHSNVWQPLEHEFQSKYDGMVRVYRLPSVGKRYCLYTDPSEGKEDYHCIMVIDARTGEEVAESHGKIPTDELAVIHDELVRFYNNCLNSWESGPGGAGGILTIKLKEMETPNQCASLDVSRRPFRLDTKSGKRGWWGSRSFREVSYSRLEEAIRKREIILHSAESLDELSRIKQVGQGIPSKVRGGHDDYVDACSGVMVLKDFVPLGEIRVQVFDWTD